MMLRMLITIIKQKKEKKMPLFPAATAGSRCFALPEVAFLRSPDYPRIRSHLAIFPLLL